MNVKNTVSGGGPIATRFSLAEIVELVGGAIPPVRHSAGAGGAGQY